MRVPERPSVSQLHVDTPATPQIQWPVAHIEGTRGFASQVTGTGAIGIRAYRAGFARWRTSPPDSRLICC
jgi:hypothetical protein